VQSRSLIGGIVAIAVLAGLSFAAWRYINVRADRICRACARPIHAHMRTVAIVDGKRTIYCCPACALSEHEQSAKQVQVVELTDYLTGSPLKPDNSYVVRNSDVNPCLQHTPAIGENQQPLESHFDRCNPSVLAFSDRSAAAGFAVHHGGQVLKFSDFTAAYTH